MPDIAFQCSNCQQPLIVDSAGAGLEIFCPGCGATLTVPRLTQDTTPPVTAQTEGPQQASPKKRSAHRREHKTTGGAKPAAHGGQKPGPASRGAPAAPEARMAVPDLATQATELKSRLARTEGDLESAMAARRDLEDEARRANAKLAAHDARAKENLTSLQSRLENENNRLRQECERRTRDADTLAAKLDESEASRVQCENRLAETKSSLEEEIRRGEQRLAASEAAAAGRVAEVSARSHADIESLQNEIRRHAKDAQTTRAQLRESEASRTRCEAALAETRAELERSKTEMEKRMQDIASGQEALAAAQERMAEFQSAAAASANAAAEQMAAIESRLGAASARIGELEEALRVTEGALTDAGRANEELQEKLGASEQGALRLRSELADAQSQGAALARDLNMAREDSAKSRQERGLMRSEKEATRAEANRLRREVHEAIDRLQRTTSLKERLDEDLREAMAELEGFRSGDMVRENKVLKGIIERRNAEAQKEREDMVRSRRSLQGLRRWVVILLWVTGFSLIAAIIEAVLLWAKFSMP